MLDRDPGCESADSSLLDTASVAIDLIMREARRRSLAVSVAVCGHGGRRLIAFASDDEAPWFVGEVALRKARTAAAFQLPTSALASMQSEYSEVFAIVCESLDFRPTVLAGGICWPSPWGMLGVGVSGADETEDEALARLVRRDERGSEDD